MSSGRKASHDGCRATSKALADRDQALEIEGGAGQPYSCVPGIRSICPAGVVIVSLYTSFSTRRLVDQDFITLGLELDHICVVDIKRHPERIEARAEVSAGSRNVDAYRL